MTRTLREKRVSLLFLILLTVAALYLTFLIARPFLTPIITAALLAIAIYPPFRWLRRHMKNGSAAALVATLLVLIAILLPSVMIVNKVAHETTALYKWLNEQQLKEGSWSEYASKVVDRPLQWIADRTGLSQDELKNTALNRLQSLSAALLQWAKSLAVNIGQTIVDLVTVLVTLFFLLRDGEWFIRRIGSILPIEPHRYQQLSDTISASIIANVYGVLAVAISQGLLGAIAYAIAGLPSVVLWTVTTALFSMIPLVGTACVWVVACIYLLANGRWGMAIFMLAWGVGVISMADNIVRPLVLSGRVKLHTLLVFFALLGGMQVFGVVGLFLGPIIVSVATALLDILGEERAAWERDKEPLITESI